MVRKHIEPNLGLVKAIRRYKDELICVHLQDYNQVFGGGETPYDDVNSVKYRDGSLNPYGSISGYNI